MPPPRPDSSSNMYIHARGYEDALHSSPLRGLAVGRAVIHCDSQRMAAQRTSALLLPFSPPPISPPPSPLPTPHSSIPHPTPHPPSPLRLLTPPSPLRLLTPPISSTTPPSHLRLLTPPSCPGFLAPPSDSSVLHRPSHPLPSVLHRPSDYFRLLTPRSPLRLSIPPSPR